MEETPLHLINWSTLVVDLDEFPAWRFPSDEEIAEAMRAAYLRLRDEESE